MVYLRACPKCHGDLYDAKDIHGSFLSCLQCGYLRDLGTPNVTVLVEKTPKEISGLAEEMPQLCKRRPDPSVEGAGSTLPVSGEKEGGWPWAAPLAYSSKSPPFFSGSIRARTAPLSKGSRCCGSRVAPRNRERPRQ